MSRFCIDCKHSVVPPNSNSFSSFADTARCHHESAVDLTKYLVTGTTTDVRFQWCSTMRAHDSKCGPLGSHFTPKETPEPETSDADPA